MAARRATALVDRYELYDSIASGGMATVYLGRRRGSVGFAHVVAIKRIHQHLAENVEFVEMFIDEARLASRVRHPNVVPIVDIVDHEGELLLVMDYVAGVSLSQALKAARANEETAPLGVVVRVLVDALRGLHAAHTATDEQGDSLGIVHRDVSPHNLLVGADGVTRLLDFGVAKATGRLHRTRTGELKGKAGYMAPEQMRGEAVDRRADLYSLGLIGWEATVGRPAFDGDTDVELMNKALSEPIVSPAELVPTVPASLAEVIMRLLERTPAKRYATALEAVAALEAASVDMAPPREVSAWLKQVSADMLSARAEAVTRVEQSPADDADEQDESADEPHESADEPEEPDGQHALTSELPTIVDGSLRPPASATSWKTPLAAAALIAIALAAGWYLGRGDATSTSASDRASMTATPTRTPAPTTPVSTSAVPSEPVATQSATVAPSVSAPGSTPPVTAVQPRRPRPRPAPAPAAPSASGLQQAPDDLLGRD